MIAGELADGSLAQLLEVEVIRPFGYWLDIASRYGVLEHDPRWRRENPRSRGACRATRLSVRMRMQSCFQPVSVAVRIGARETTWETKISYSLHPAFIKEES